MGWLRFASWKGQGDVAGDEFGVLQGLVGSSGMFGKGLGEVRPCLLLVEALKGVKKHGLY